LFTFIYFCPLGAKCAVDVGVPILLYFVAASEKIELVEVGDQTKGITI